MTPSQRHYDLVIIGGAMIGSSAAWWTARDPSFKGRVLVIERDPSYQFASPPTPTPASVSSSGPK